jgi:RNA polymerase sigma-70 factor, ECF subfamily
MVAVIAGVAGVWRVADADDEARRVRAAAAGDRTAAGELCAELLPRIRNLIRYLVRGDADVDDIAQEALIAVLKGLPGYRGEGALSSWADRIAVRVTFASLRKRRSAERLHDDRRDLTLVPDPGGAPDQYAVRRELVGLLDELPAEQRHALVLHHVLEMTVPEIAEELGVKFETVRSRLRLGRNSLRALHEQAQREPRRRGA